MSRFYVASFREVRKKTPGQGCLMEFEDVLARCCGAALIVPKPVPARRGTAAWLTGPGPGLRVDPIPPRRGGDTEVLFIVATGLRQVPQLLAAIPGWRERFDVVAPYIFDAFPYKADVERPAWRRRFSPFLNVVTRLNHLFVPMTGSIAPWSRSYGVPVTMVPMACDVVQYGHGGPDRSIDVMGYGRQHSAHSDTIARAYNDPASPRMYYHTNHMQIGGVVDHYQQRRFFWKLLIRSRIALAYDPRAVDPMNKFPFSFVSQRWFESITAGCLVVGRRPTCPEVDELLDWEDATVEIPEAETEVIPFLEELLEDRDRLDAAYRRNHAQALARHDWRDRVARMLNALGLDHPEPLRRELDALHERTRQLATP